MDSVVTYQINSLNVETTELLGAQVGAQLRGGEVITLSSDLGGGKTAYVRGIAKGMGSKDHVSSPTFTLTREYRVLATGITLYHFDFYRLSEPGLMALELQEVLADPTAVVAIEWGDIVNGVLPDERLDIKFTSTSENERKLLFRCSTNLAYLLAAISTNAENITKVESTPC